MVWYKLLSIYYDGKSIGTHLGDAIRNITGAITGTIAGRPGYWDTALEGAFYVAGQNDASTMSYIDSDNISRWTDIGFSAARVVPTANEFRPGSTSVWYGISY